MYDQLTVKNLSHQFENTMVLSDINFTLDQGTVNCILGASGSGKTTLLRLIAGFEKIQQGSICYGDLCFSSAQERHHLFPEKRNIGMVFQDHALFPHLSVKENLLFGLKKHNKRRIKWVLEAADRIKIAHLLDKYPFEISGGEKQRVSLLRSLAPRPSLLLLDEPFSALDPHLKQQMRDETLSFIKSIGITTIIVTHDPFEASYMGDHILILDQGLIVQQGKSYDLKVNPKTSMIAEFFGAINIIQTTIRDGYLHLPILNHPIAYAGDDQNIIVQFYPEDVHCTAGGEFILKQQSMVEYGGIKRIFTHKDTAQDYIVYDTQQNLYEIGSSYTLSIDADKLMLFSISPKSIDQF